MSTNPQPAEDAARAYAEAAAQAPALEARFVELCERLADAQTRLPWPKDVEQTRSACAAVEAALDAVVGQAHDAHKRYWSARLAELQPALLEAARTVRLVDAVARAAGHAGAHPGRALLENCLRTMPVPDVSDSPVPAALPWLSYELSARQGSWRR